MSITVENYPAWTVGSMPFGVSKCQKQPAASVSATAGPPLLRVVAASRGRRLSGCDVVLIRRINNYQVRLQNLPKSISMERHLEKLHFQPPALAFAYPLLC